jgi:hypothetical protein
MGLFQGASQLGTGIAGLMGYEDPEIAQARQRQGMLGGLDVNDPLALRQAAKDINDPEAQLFLSDRALKIEEAKRKAQGVGSGTGPERMLNFMAQVDADLAANVPVSEADKNKAKFYREYFAKRKTYQMPDGSLVTLDTNDYRGQQDTEAQGGVPTSAQPSPTPSTPPTASPAPGVRVTETPASKAAQAKVEEGKRQEQVVFESDINQIDKALNIVQTSGRLAAGIGSWLSFIPESSASDLADTIESIDAAKLIQQIQALKQTSPTGSTGFGSLTEKEGSQLISRLGSIKQTKSPQKLAESLLEVRALLGKLAGKESTPSGGSSDNEELINRVMADPRNKGKTRQQIEAGLRKRGLIK